MTLKTKSHSNQGSLNKQTISWCLYDWANTAFGTVIITFIYSVYFARGIIGDETEGAAIWGYAIGASGLLIALLSPIFGAIADESGRRKPWILFFTLLCCIFTALLWFGTPAASPYLLVFVLLCLILANIGLEMGTVFYNAMLPQIAAENKMGRVSGIAWAMGYFGGLACLVTALFGLVGLGEIQPLLNLPQENSEHLRAVAPLTALWLLVFALPLFFFVQEKTRSNFSYKGILSRSFQTLRQTIGSFKDNKNLSCFLIASALYRDGLNTLFSVGGIYAAGEFGMDFDEILIFAIGLNVTAGLGAAAFAFLDDFKGSKLTISLSLCGLIGLGIAILLIDDKTTFMILALFLGIFMGPAQAASRTLAGRLAPQDIVTQTYGFYAFTGKSIAFTGPLLYGFMTDVFGTQQAGMISIIGFWFAGLVLLSFVREK